MFDADENVCGNCKWWMRSHHDHRIGACQYDPPPVFWKIINLMTDVTPTVDYRQSAEEEIITKEFDQCSEFREKDDGS